MTTSPEPSELAQLEAAARHHRERFASYRARTRSPHARGERRYHELERAAKRAEGRLLHARRAAAHLN